MNWLQINEKLKNAKQIGNVGKKIFTTAIGMLGYSNRYIGMEESREKVYRYIENKYSYILECYNPDMDRIDPKCVYNEKIIWACWWQGVENAPRIVQRCFESVEYYMSDWQFKVITKENYLEYVDFPKYILDKWDDGTISNTMMSDLLRLELLIRYGGLWLDATVYLTDRIPDYVFEKKLFLFKQMNNEFSNIIYNSWLIFSVKDDRLLKTVRYMLYEYWKKEKKQKEYFLWHLMVTMILRKHPEFVTEIYCIPDEIAHILQSICFDDFDLKYWYYLTSLNSIHKLSTKLQVPEIIEGTYYMRIMNGEFIE